MAKLLVFSLLLSISWSRACPEGTGLAHVDSRTRIWYDGDTEYSGTWNYVTHGPESGDMYLTHVSVPAETIGISRVSATDEVKWTVKLSTTRFPSIYGLHVDSNEDYLMALLSFNTLVILDAKDGKMLGATEYKELPKSSIYASTLASDDSLYSIAPRSSNTAYTCKYRFGASLKCRTPGSSSGTIDTSVIAAPDNELIETFMDASDNKTYFRKYNFDSGDISWEKTYACTKDCGIARTPGMEINEKGNKVYTMWNDDEMFMVAGLELDSGTLASSGVAKIDDKCEMYNTIMRRVGDYFFILVGCYTHSDDSYPYDHLVFFDEDLRFNFYEVSSSVAYYRSYTVSTRDPDTLYMFGYTAQGYKSGVIARVNGENLTKHPDIIRRSLTYDDVTSQVTLKTVESPAALSDIVMPEGTDYTSSIPDTTSGQTLVFDDSIDYRDDIHYGTHSVSATMEVPDEQAMIAVSTTCSMSGSEIQYSLVLSNGSPPPSWASLDSNGNVLIESNAEEGTYEFVVKSYIRDMSETVTQKVTLVLSDEADEMVAAEGDSTSDSGKGCLGVNSERACGSLIVIVILMCLVMIGILCFAILGGYKSFKKRRQERQEADLPQVTTGKNLDNIEYEAEPEEEIQESAETDPNADFEANMPPTAQQLSENKGNRGRKPPIQIQTKADNKK